MMIHVPQRHPSDCAIATAAMVANVSYEEATEELWPLPTTRGLSVLHMRALLESLTGLKWRITRFILPRSVAKFPSSEEPAVLLTQHPWRFWAWHYIAMMGEWVHDASFGWGFKRKHYPRRNWHVIRVLKPATAGSLNVVCRQRWLQRYIEWESSLLPIADGSAN